MGKPSISDSEKKLVKILKSLVKHLFFFTNSLFIRLNDDR